MKKNLFLLTLFSLIFLVNLKAHASSFEVIEALNLWCSQELCEQGLELNFDSFECFFKEHYCDLSISFDNDRSPLHCQIKKVSGWRDLVDYHDLNFSSLTTPKNLILNQIKDCLAHN